MSVDLLRRRLADGEVVVIDGGMGPELHRRGVPLDPIAWAGPVVLEHADAVRAAHVDYIRAGADVIIANTFMAGYLSLAAAGFGDRAEEINRRTIEVALEAREEAADRPVLVAGALFPGYFGAEENMMIPLGATREELRAAVREQAEVLVDAGADLLALEMTPTGDWGHLTVEAIADLGVPVWVGVSAGPIEGTPIMLPFDPPGQIGEQVRQILDGTTADVMAVNVMHTEVGWVDRTLDDIQPHWSGPIGCYPHFGTHDPDGSGAFVTEAISPDEYAALARHWVDRGVQLVGGCCGIGPEHVRALKEQLPARVG